MNNVSLKNLQGDMVEATTPDAEIVLYICPTPDCNDHYAAPDFRPDNADITTMQYSRSQNDGSMHPAHSRIECPTCRTRGIRVKRIPHVVVGVVPLVEMAEAVTGRYNIGHEIMGTKPSPPLPPLGCIGEFEALSVYEAPPNPRKPGNVAPPGPVR